MTALPVHGHMIPPPFSHVMFVGRNNRMRALVVVYRGGRNVYMYRLGDSYDPGLCCKLAQLPHPGEFINQHVKKFPVEILA